MASRVSLNSIKTNIKSLLDASNTTTASIIDLSADLSNNKRVKKVLTINPEMIIPQASIFPLVTCYITNKQITSNDIAKDQLTIKRRATVSVSIVGSIWNSNFVDITKDPADDDINYLMENIELILRSDYNLSNSCNWQKVTECKFYTTVLDEQTHLRSGIINLDCEVYY